MGVQGLWTLVGPAARPTQLESLRQKRIAVDASIWIHQFMRTMRDKQGNALRNGHLLGFFRRLCKLLFYDIKPVFVFDGGAPVLKRNTIRERRRRREGMKINMKATARKILSAQVKSRVIMEEEKKRRGEQATNDEEYVYYEQLEKSAAVDVLRKNRKLDQYELPEINQNQIHPDRVDPRLATAQEIKEFIEEYMPSDMDIDSETFKSLPPEIQYEIIQDLKLKSRQTSWARLDQMIRNSKTALDFSKQQIKLLKHRNEMTQRVMQMNTVAGGTIVSEPARVAGERGREYILYKNENIEQGLGWKLPGISAANPVYIDPVQPPTSATEDIESDEEEEEEEKDKGQTDEEPFTSIISEDEDEALFMDYSKPNENKRDHLLNDMNAYADDEAIDQVISRIYAQDAQDARELNSRAKEEQGNSALSLGPDDFLNLWISRAPDAFLYLYSFNDEYKRILRSAIFDSDIPTLQNQLMSIRKQFGKTREGDELALESLQFQESFLENVIQWKQNNRQQHNAIAREQQPLKTENDLIEPTLEDNIIQDTSIFDDDDDEIIQFVEAGSSQKSETDDKPSQSVTPLREPVHINVSQSLLYTKPDEKSGVNKISENEDNRKQEKDTQADKNTMSPEKIGYNGQTENNEEDDDSESTSIEYEEVIPMHTFDNVNSSKEKEANDEPQRSDKVENEAVAVTVTANGHGYDSEEELDDNVQGEDDEYARFISNIASRNIEDVKRELYEDIKDLNAQQRKEKGNTDDITDQMIQDIQELLKLFGIPYIVSPMEAEAQCAELERLNLIEGTITDDSDVFLFGATRVYKNMFNQQRFVEFYKSQDIEREMMLSRTKLIQLAYLLGSDYTEGIPGRKGHKDLEIPADFPNPLVKEAYLHPTVDSSKQQFKWGQPQLDSLRVFLMEAFGWPEEKADQVLLPVLQEMNKRTAVGEQSTINSFFSPTTGPVKDITGSKHSSKRVQNIVEKWRKQKRAKH
ncbi:hypothetical protein RMCBS344292_14211 [Rhizopus microsporus]|nr:hypothetical protein RMCBS344292_14211 [Rhizopus microsporus]